MDIPPEECQNVSMKWERPSGTQDEEDDALLPKSLKSTRLNGRRWIYYMGGFLFGLSVFLNIITLLQRSMRDLDEMCSLYTSESPSPASQDIRITSSSREFNGSFLEPSKYTSDPSPAVDEAWLALGTQANYYPLPSSLAPHHGLSTSHARLSTGEYPVLFEFEHHLHCVNLLRQSSFWNYHYYKRRGQGPFANSPDIVKRHVNHCTDILRQVIQCQPDTGVFGQYWVKHNNAEADGAAAGTEKPFVDFHTRHKCKNFEEIRDWVLGHQVSDEVRKLARVVRMPGDLVLDSIP